jgi:hypothetical protein
LCERKGFRISRGSVKLGDSSAKLVRIISLLRKHDRAGDDKQHACEYRSDADIPERMDEAMTAHEQ